MYDLVSLGEVMLRLSPPRYERLRQVTLLNVRLCGAQFNLAADLALLGKKTAFLSRLPDNELGLLAREGGTRYGIDMSHVQLVPDTRMGVVYLEFGLEPRETAHIYDRRGSAASTIIARDFAWQSILKGTRLAYTDGIFPGLSAGCREAAFEFVKVAKQQGCTLCFDVNYRQMIWTMDEARTVYRQILPHVDILVTNRSVSESVFGYQGADEDLLQHYQHDFGCQVVCLTSRTAFGALHGGWNSLALHKDRIFHGRQFGFDIVDRFGTGDAFFAGFLYGYLERDVEFGLDFGNALCALAHTIEGDIAHVSADTVMKLLTEGYGSRIKR
ncbi:MAG: sugar kinase [Chloroflexi bacterium]|nr:sugar kinase [Chloroflexota bacterium]